MTSFPATSTPPRVVEAGRPGHQAPPSRRLATAARAVPILASIVFVGSFGPRLLNPGFTDDHFRLLVEARQILAGELPFRDFADPGVFLQLQLSALFQLLFGDILLGEALLCIFFLSAGYALTFVLAARASRSVLVALVVTICVVAMAPRLYAYDKVFLLVLGVFVLWRYAERPTVRNLAVVALCTAVAFLVRHDHGVYITAGALTAIVASHWRAGPAPVVRRMAFYAAFGTLPLLPFLAFLEANGGAAEYFRSAAEYTRVRGEDRRESDERLRFTIDPTAEPIELRPGVGLSVAPGILRPANAVPWLYYLFFGLPVTAMAVLLIERVRGGPDSERTPAEATKILSAAVLCLAADRLLLRQPLDVRLADAAAPTAVIAAWLLGQWLGLGPRSAAKMHLRWPARIRGRPGIGRPVRSAVARAARWATGVLVVGVTWLSIASVADVPDQVRRTGVLSGPAGMSERWAGTLGELRAMPAIDAWASPDSGGRRALARYVYECTKPADRLVVTWFAPDIYFYAGRAFSGRQLFWFPGYYASAGEQDASVERMRQDSVPIVIQRTNEFPSHFERVHRYIVENYRLTPEVRFGEAVDTPYRVYVDTRLAPTGTYRRFSLPCYR